MISTLAPPQAPPMTLPYPYHPPLPQPLAAPIRVDTCDTWRFMNPHPGIWDEPATVPGYCYASPNGDNNLGSRPTANYSLLTANWSFTFSAKEKDSETSLSYFGSRYYSSGLSIWLSVDPMSAKYTSLSPYTYCANNPVRCVDPNGEEIGQYLDWNGNFLGTDGRSDFDLII
jgi:RHS repeat-associated protein